MEERKVGYFFDKLYIRDGGSEEKHTAAEEIKLCLLLRHRNVLVDRVPGAKEIMSWPLPLGGNKIQSANEPRTKENDSTQT